MKKLSLNVEDLAIETFETAAAAREEGTVEGYAATNGNKYTCDPAVGTCFGYTCYESCETICGTCGDTCDPVVGTCFGYTCYEGCRV